MNKANKFALTLATGVAFIMGGSSALAATDTGNLSVSATINGTCTIGDATLAAGVVDPTLNAAVPFQTTVAVLCTSGTTANIGFNEGGGPGADTTDRYMTSGGDHLRYQIYQDSGHNTNWGNDVGTDTFEYTGSGVSENVPIYGLIPAGQTSAHAGGYADTVVMTITF